MISTKYSKNIFFTLLLSISVLPLNTFSLLKYIPFIIIILFLNTIKVN